MTTKVRTVEKNVSSGRDARCYGYNAQRYVQASYPEHWDPRIPIRQSAFTSIAQMWETHFWLQGIDGGTDFSYYSLLFQIAQEIAACREDISLIGALQMFLTASTPHQSSTNTDLKQLTASSTVCSSDVQKALQPSVSAKSAEAVVVDVSWAIQEGTWA